MLLNTFKSKCAAADLLYSCMLTRDCHLLSARLLSRTGNCFNATVQPYQRSHAIACRDDIVSTVVGKVNTARSILPLLSKPGSRHASITSAAWNTPSRSTKFRGRHHTLTCRTKRCCTRCAAPAQ
jgi:hypothetical protein